jgi:hypothetical protein
MVVDDKADAINALIDAVESIEHELGITPSGVYSDVRVRFDILEARINDPLVPAPNVENPFFIGNDGVSISTGDGYPTENRLSGSLYLRKDGYNNEGLYTTRPDGYWHLIDTDPWTAAGDLAGTIYTQTVIGFQNRPFRSAAPIDTLAGDGYVIGWNSTDGYWEPQAGFYAFGDLTGDKLNQTIINLQGTPIVIGTLNNSNDGYSLIWNNTIPQWEPQKLAIIFDPLNSGSTTNIRANKYNTQSPIDNTKIGIINLGSDSIQTTAGVTANYGTLLGGDSNEVAGDYSVIVGGNLNSISGTFGFIGGGAANLLSGNNSVIVGGNNNSSISDNSFIGGGVSNFLHASPFSIVLGGQTNSIDSSGYSVIISGELNEINGTSLRFASILGGSSNIINGTADGYLTILGGYLNTIDGYYNLIGTGENNAISITSQYSSILNGSNNLINSSWATIFGNYGKAIFNSQFVHSADAIDGITAGSAQYSRLLLSGSGVSGNQFDLQIPTTSANLVLENNKSYDMSIRVLINNTDGGFVCARHIFDVLARCESNILTLDVINITLSNENGTGWTVSLSTSGNQLIVRIDAAGGNDRQAVATVEWRELSN